MNKRYDLNDGFSLASARRTVSPCAEDVLIGQDIGRSKPDAEDILGTVEVLSKVRKRRGHFLPTELFAEPAWDMLLALYRADALGYRMTVSNLCRESEAPPTTALRWIDRLSELGEVQRRKNPLDARVIFVELTPTSREKLRDYLVEAWGAMVSWR